MKLEQSFEVNAPIERVWNALIDVEHVAPCLPGAAVTGRNDDGSYNGTITIKIGPTTANYAGKLEMRDVDESARSTTMYANGTDKRGQGGATATINSVLKEANGVTRVDVVTDYHITGRLARFGRGGMIEDVSKRLLREFAKRLQDSIVADPATPEPEVAASAPEPEPEPEAPAPPETTAPEADETPAAHETESQPTKPSATVPPPAADPPQPPPPPRQPIEPAEPIQGLSLAGGVIADRIKSNPLPLVVGFLLALLIFRRRRSR
jgi:carbon monoxide dehydrogenase subunit G